jgi:hypothetical protein
MPAQIQNYKCEYYVSMIRQFEKVVELNIHMRDMLIIPPSLICEDQKNKHLEMWKSNIGINNYRHTNS